MEEKHIQKDFVTMQDVADAMLECNAGIVTELDDKGHVHMVCTKSITIVASGVPKDNDLPPGVF